MAYKECVHQVPKLHTVESYDMGMSGLFRPL
jgi:hypothetical protein